jgi:predicted AlkP superfamily pyrophosphatase or phosphodiesterase
METVYPARTVVCFSSMFTGTYPFEHGIKSNMVWRLGIKTESIFDSLRKVGKKGRLLGIAHLVDSMGSDVETVTAVMHKDKADAHMLAKARKIMKEQDPDLFVVQLIGTDQVGHSRGVLYDDYLEKIEEADAHIKEFVDWLHQEGKMENTTLIICADHGQADGIGGHGHLDEGERFVPFFMHGPNIEKGNKVQEKHSLVSLAPTISYLLGAPYPSSSRGHVLMDAINEQKDESRS